MTEPDRSLRVHSAALRAAVEPIVLAAGFDLEEIVVVPAGRRRLVRVVIDSDAGVDLDAAAEVSTRLSTRLDDDTADEVLGGAPYTLEVTSPGIGRPLTLPRHFRRAAGRIVSITRADGTTSLARVRRVDGDILVLLGGPDGLQESTIPLADIRRAVVEVEFTPVPAPVAALLAADADSAGGAGNGDGRDAG